MKRVQVEKVREHEMEEAEHTGNAESDSEGGSGAAAGDACKRAGTTLGLQPREQVVLSPPSCCSPFSVFPALSLLAREVLSLALPSLSRVRAVSFSLSPSPSLSLSLFLSLFLFSLSPLPLTFSPLLSLALSLDLFWRHAGR